METTFITIQDLSKDARILYCSDSIVDILGYTPDEVLYRSSWEFFHPDELSWARTIHTNTITLDKAAVLAYCQLRNKNGDWIGCECCFSICYDVLVVCISIYHQSLASQRRAAEAPIVRRLFSSTKDPRYHMLEHLSPKFRQDVKSQSPEPRAALFLNRFTRTLTVMYATNGIEQILGISGESMKGRSFYYCIAENCLEAAVNCVETAKSNDSIAYLRFWFRDPRQDDAPPDSSTDEGGTDAEMTDVVVSEDEDIEGGVQLTISDHTPLSGHATSRTNSLAVPGTDNSTPASADRTPMSHLTHQRSGESLPQENTTAGIFGRSVISSRSSISSAPSTRPSHSVSANSSHSLELEAVVSCTSDGLVVCLRKARPAIPRTQQTAPSSSSRYPNGLFAAPWANRPTYTTSNPPQPQVQSQQHASTQPPPVLVDGEAASRTDLMASIREIATFAWALTGINGSLVDYSRGSAKGKAQPPPPPPPDSPVEYHNNGGAVGGDRSARRPSTQNGVWPFRDPGL